MTVLNIVAIVWTLLALAIVPTQLRMTAPYGRHARTDWGPMVPNQLGWFLMELVSLVVFAGLFLAGPNDKDHADVGVLRPVDPPLRQPQPDLSVAHAHQGQVHAARHRRQRGGVQHRQCRAQRALSRLARHGLSRPPGSATRASSSGSRCSSSVPRSISGPTTGSSACVPAASRDTPSRAVACSSGCRAPTISARSSSGRALR